MRSLNLALIAGLALAASSAAAFAQQADQSKCVLSGTRVFCPTADGKYEAHEVDVPAQQAASQPQQYEVRPPGGFYSQAYPAPGYYYPPPVPYYGSWYRPGIAACYRFSRSFTACAGF